MPYRFVCPLLLAATLALPNIAHAQPRDTNDHDRLWNGMLIGAAIGAAVGMLIAPPAFCGGGHDTECATIVRATIGLGSIAAGVGVGALVDGLMSRDASMPFGNTRSPTPRLSGVQMTVRW
jgi:hypothetical protein